MYSVSTSLASALANRKLYVRVSYGNTVLDTERVTNCNYNASCGGAETVTIGGVTAATITLTITGRIDLLNQVIAVEVGVLVPTLCSTFRWANLPVSECQQGEDSTVVTGYDAAYYGMGIDYVPAVPSGATVAAVLDDVAGQCGLAVAGVARSSFNYTSRGRFDWTHLPGDGRTCSGTSWVQRV